MYIRLTTRTCRSLLTFITERNRSYNWRILKESWSLSVPNFSKNVQFLRKNLITCIAGTFCRLRLVEDIWKCIHPKWKNLQKSSVNDSTWQPIFISAICYLFVCLNQKFYTFFQTTVKDNWTCISVFFVKIVYSSGNVRNVMDSSSVLLIYETDTEVSETAEVLGLVADEHARYRKVFLNISKFCLYFPVHFSW